MPSSTVPQDDQPVGAPAERHPGAPSPTGATRPSNASPASGLPTRPLRSARRTLVALVLPLVFATGCSGGGAGVDATADASTPRTSATVPPVTTTAVEGPPPPAPADVAASGASATDVTYCRTGGTDLKLDFFHANTDAPTPLVVFIHGGGYRRGDKKQAQRLPEFDALRTAGYSIASVNYRLSPDHPFPAPIVDVKCAIRHLRANATAYGIDPARIATMGFSAGGHLALLAGFADPAAGFDTGQYQGVPSTVRAVVQAAGPIDFALLTDEQPEVVQDLLGNSPPLIAQANPLQYLDPADPPVLTFHGELDRTVPVHHAQALDEELAATGVRHVLHVIPGGDHEWPSQTGRGGDRSGADYSETVLQFLTESLA